MIYYLGIPYLRLPEEISALDLLTKVLRKFECFDIPATTKNPANEEFAGFCCFLRCYSVRPKGFEPLSMVPETIILSIELRALSGL